MFCHRQLCMFLEYSSVSLQDIQYGLAVCDARPQRDRVKGVLHLPV
jgi:hypothetical protein